MRGRIRTNAADVRLHHVLLVLSPAITPVSLIGQRCKGDCYEKNGSRILFLGLILVAGAAWAEPDGIWKNTTGTPAYSFYVQTYVGNAMLVIVAPSTGHVLGVSGRGRRLHERIQRLPGSGRRSQQFIDHVYE